MFSEKAVLYFAQRYTDKITSVELLGVSHNTVYKVNCDNPFILRITSEQHRSKAELTGEVNFISYLHSKGAQVAAPISSLENELISEIYFENETLFLTAFTIAEGLQWHERADSDYFKHIGSELGRIHKHSRNYQAASEIRRRQYFESQHLIKAFDIFEKHNPRLYIAYKTFLERLSRLPKNAGNYGLIHGDFLLSNYNITPDNKVTVYDFDECEYSWFVSDIATILYYFLTGGDPSRTAERADEAVSAILEIMSGYLAENDLSIEELRNLDLFFRLRDYVLLSTIIGRGDETLAWWDALLVPTAMDRALNDKPFVEIDISSVIDKLIAKP